MGPAIGRRTLTKYSSYQLKSHSQMEFRDGRSDSLGLVMGVFLNSENVVLVRIYCSYNIGH